jgi:hypothetical protein
MNLPSTRLPASLCLLLLLSSSASVAVFAQDSSIIPSNKVLVVAREYTKPGKDHSPHQKTESAYVSASAASKAASHYYAVTSLSGPQRALFFYSYPSFAAWEAENKGIEQDTTLSAALDSANIADGDLLSSTDASVWLRRDDMSLNPGYRVGARYTEISHFRIKPGHHSDWDDLVKMVIAGYKKGVPEAHWGAYEEAYGTPGDGFIFITTIKSGADLDGEFASGPRFEAAMGPDGLKKLDELAAACIDSEMTNLFSIDPKMSYPPDAFVKAEPDFWKPKQ